MSQLDYEDEPSDDEDGEEETEEEEEAESDDDQFEDALEKLTLNDKPAVVAVAA